MKCPGARLPFQGLVRGLQELQAVVLACSPLIDHRFIEWATGVAGLSARINTIRLHWRTQLDDHSPARTGVAPCRVECVGKAIDIEVRSGKSGQSK